MSRNIVITGGTGFLGSNLIDAFTKEDIYNLGRNRNEKCNNIYWNLKSGIEIKKLPKDIDTLIHCAAVVGERYSSTREFIDINILSTIQLLECCTNMGITQFMYISTGGVYGYGKNPFREDNSPKPQGIYSISKYISEELCREYGEKFKITILRPFFPYGNGQKERLIPNLINKITSEEEVILNEGGMPLVNPVYIEDFCNVIKGVVDKRIEGIFNVCGNESLSIKELCELIAKKNKKEKVKFIYNNKNIENLLGCNEKIQSALNNPIKTSISEGIDKILKGEKNDHI